MNEDISFKKAFLITLIVSLTISSLIGIYLFLFGQFRELEIKILITTLAVGGFSLTGLISSIWYDKREFVLLALAGITFSILGFLIVVLGIWEVFRIDNYWKLIAIFIILPISVAHISLMLLSKSTNNLVNVVLSLTIILNLVVSLIFIIAIIGEIDEKFIFRLIGTFMILTVLGTIVTPILNKVTN